MAKKSGAKSARARNRGNPGAAPQPTRGPHPNPIVPVERPLEPRTDVVLESRAPTAPVTPAAPVRPVRPTPFGTARAASSPLRARSTSHLPISTDYGYVIADLKRIGLLAGAALAVLAGLTFVIH